MFAHTLIDSHPLASGEGVGGEVKIGNMTSPITYGNMTKNNLNSQRMTLQEAQQQVDDWIKLHGVRYFSELTNMAMLTEEVGEVARIMARRHGDQSEKESDKNKDLGEELADVLWVLICLANQTGVDLTKAFNENLEKKTIRDKDRHHQNPKLK